MINYKLYRRYLIMGGESLWGVALGALVVAQALHNFTQKTLSVGLVLLLIGLLLCGGSVYLILWSFRRANEARAKGIALGSPGFNGLPQTDEFKRYRRLVQYGGRAVFGIILAALLLIGGVTQALDGNGNLTSDELLAAIGAVILVGSIYVLVWCRKQARQIESP